MINRTTILASSAVLLSVALVGCNPPAPQGTDGAAMEASSAAMSEKPTKATKSAASKKSAPAKKAPTR